jgi:hypothetical protein
MHLLDRNAAIYSTIDSTNLIPELGLAICIFEAFVDGQLAPKGEVFQRQVPTKYEG